MFRRVVAYAITVLVACGLAGAPVVGAGASDTLGVPEGIARLLEDRGRAFEENDRDLFTATLDPGPFAEEQLAAFEHASAVPIDRYHLEVSTRFVESLLTPRVESAYPGEEIAAYHVAGETALGGLETESYVHNDFFTFVRRVAGEDRYDGWRIASNSDFEVLGLFSAHHIWDTGPVTAISSDRFLLLTHPDHAGGLETVVDVAEQAYDELAARWPRPLERGFVIVAPASSEELGRILETTLDLENFVAFAGGSMRPERGWEPAGVRLFLNLPRFGLYAGAGQRIILAHELVHAVLRPISGPHIPTWVEEGIAMYASEPDDGLARARQGPLPDDFPTDEAFTIGGVGGIVTQYRRSQVAMGALAERHGPDGVLDFYEALGRARVVPGTSTHHVRRAVEEALDWSIAEWREAWLQRLR